ncbi:hypothetical protein KL86APRO_20135 [uncultured Alphaproteobacteria bacterium]|uniref:Uncharacterized protein n=1 Tax=uncultured Alphaproteobacteria bacterium TaxID=91750 RepID=A0A212KI20_9PROT|nr:hypothetical protein KL86APRO_20135 [uncultured Alphaproteobacteria bacterium]
MDADVQGLLTGVLAITSIGMMVANVYLARESSLQRKAGTEPNVVGYLLPDERYVQVLQFHLKNVGRGTAVHVGFEVIGETARLRKAGVRLPLETARPPLSILPQGEGIQLLFGMAHQLLKEPCPVTVRITYENVAGKRTTRDVVLDVTQFEGFSSAGKRAEDDIADTLKKIEAHLGHWESGFRKIKVVSAMPEEWRAEDEREDRYWQQQEAAAKSSQDGEAD